MLRFMGERILNRRLSLGLDLDSLADRLNVPAGRLAQQERGEARLPADQLLALAGALGVSLRDFYTVEPVAPPASSPLAWDTAELVGAYQRISDPRLQRLALQGLRTLAEAGSCSAPR